MKKLKFLTTALATATFLISSTNAMRPFNPQHGVDNLSAPTETTDVVAHRRPIVLDIHRYATDVFSVEDLVWGQYRKRSPEDVEREAIQIINDRQKTEIQARANYLANLRPNGWRPAIQSLPEGELVDNWLKAEYLQYYLVEQNRQPIYEERGQRWHEPTIEEKLRLWFMDKYISAQIPEIPQWVIDLKRQQDEQLSGT